jgi:hypothetical protein
MTGCEGVQDTTATVGTTAAPASGTVQTATSAKAVSVSAFTMTRGLGELPGRIGERTTIENVSMGYVTLNPPPEVLMTEAVKRELARAGHSTDGGPSRVSGTIREFALRTPATALYWDVIIDADVDVTVNGTTRKFVQECRKRTYAWPSDTLIADLARECSDRIARQVVENGALANAL